MGKNLQQLGLEPTLPIISTRLTMSYTVGDEIRYIKNCEHCSFIRKTVRTFAEKKSHKVTWEFSPKGLKLIQAI